MMISSVQDSLLYPLALAQVFGLFPVTGISKDSSRLRFRWFSIHHLYCFLVLAGHLAYLYFTCTSAFIHLREPNGSLSALSNATLLRRAGPMIFNILFLQISYKWPRFIRKWESIEDKLILQQSRPHLQRFIKISTVAFFVFRFVQFVISNVLILVRVAQCVRLQSLRQLVDIVFYVRYPQVMVHLPSSPSPSHYTLLVWLDVCATYSWLFADLLILDLALLLLDKLNTYNGYLDSMKTKASSVKFWRMMRLEYRKLRSLCELTDSVLSPTVFTIILLQTVFLTLQFYIMLTHSFTLLSYVYFFVLFGSLLGPDCWALLTVAAIFDQAKRPLRLLQQLPTSHTSIETKRLYNEVKFSTTGLTGCKFYVVTQSICLSIISTLVTYEVVLVQLGGLRHEGSSHSADNKSTSAADKVEYCGWVHLYLTTRT